MKIKFLGAAETVTGSKYLIETSQNRFLLDCGLYQGRKNLRMRNWEPFAVDPSKIDKVILTHAHIDHSGYLPILVREGFRGPILASSATRDLCEILLRDSGRIHEEDARRANRYGYTKHHPAIPLYTEQDAIRCMDFFEVIEFGQSYSLGEECTLQLSRAGHILGSAIVSFHIENSTIVFSGDLGRPENPVMKRPAWMDSADLLVLESTYGNRAHEKEDEKAHLGQLIRNTAGRGGTVLIPSFAVGRTQMVLYLLHLLKEAQEIPHLPIYLDSPMAQDATDLMKRHHSEHRLSKELCSKVCQIAHYIRTPEESKWLSQSPMPSIIISASGMAEGGRVLHHLKHLAPDPKNCIVFVGFQAPMTRGDQIIKGEREVKIHGSMVPIRAQVDLLEGLSSHADYNELLDWLTHFRKPPKIFLTHGEPEASKSLKQRIEERFGWEVHIPKYKEEIVL